MRRLHSKRTLAAPSRRRITSRRVLIALPSVKRTWGPLLTSLPRALVQASDADARPLSGALHGIPIAIKDIIDTHDMPTEHGSPIYKGSIPVSDAACVAMLRLAGAIVLGKTVTPEFAAVTPGRTANPHNLKHRPAALRRDRPLPSPISWCRSQSERKLSVRPSGRPLTAAWSATCRRIRSCRCKASKFRPDRSTISAS